MSTLIYPNSTVAAPSAPLHLPKWTSLWRSLCATLIAARQRQVEREIAVYLERHGGQLSDQLERDIMRRLTGSSRHLAR
jgi:hypothetical protein